MNAAQALWLTAVVAGLAGGQILFKMAATAHSAGMAVAGVPLSGTLLLGLMVYAAATLVWLNVLRTAPLSWAYPFTALAYVVVPLLAHWWLGEAIGWRTLAGGALIVAGVALAASKA